MKYSISFLLLLSLVVMVTCGGVNRDVAKPTPDVARDAKGVGPAAGGAKGPEVAKGTEDAKSKSGNSGKDIKETKEVGKDEDKKRDRRGYVLGYGHYAPAYGVAYHGLGYHGLGLHGLGYHGLGYHGLGWPYGFHG